MSPLGPGRPGGPTGPGTPGGPFNPLSPTGCPPLLVSSLGPGRPGGPTSGPGKPGGLFYFLILISDVLYQMYQVCNKLHAIKWGTIIVKLLYKHPYLIVMILHFS